MRRRTKVLLILLTVILVVGVFAVYFVKKMDQSLSELSTTEIEDIDLMTIDDGEYVGSYQAFPVSVEVKVTVLNHAMVSIELIKHDEGQGESAEVIIDDVLAEQSLEVDIITGATYSSKVMLLAIKDALSS